MTRIQAWSVAWNVAVSNPLTGGGFDYENYPDPSRWLSYADRKYDVHGQTPRAAHSIYFQVLGQHGFLCFFLFVGLLASTMVSLTSICRNARGRPGLEWIEGYAKALQTGMVGFLVSGAFLNLAYFDLVYLYIGLVPILRRELREHGALAPAVTPQHVSYVTRTL
jgi:probable O-glycosylation ligase (exosortase A-associated)